METYFLFVDSGSVAYAYSARNLKGITTSSASVTMNFTMQTGGTADNDMDTVVLTVTAGKEKTAMLAILKLAQKPGTSIVEVADDNLSQYCHSSITAVAVTPQA